MWQKLLKQLMIRTVHSTPLKRGVNKSESLRRTETPGRSAGLRKAL